MSKKAKTEKKKDVSESTLSFGEYNSLFQPLVLGSNVNLKDSKSGKSTYIPIKVTDEKVYFTEPDGKLIPDIQGQKKCDFLIFSQKCQQTCFVEMKGENISVKDEYNPYDQIGDTIQYLNKNEILKSLVNTKVEKHAFIVSPGRQKIPKGVESKERILWKKLAQPTVKTKISDLVHYVKVTKSDRYSNNKDQIICSSKSPIIIPFKN